MVKTLFEYPVGLVANGILPSRSFSYAYFSKITMPLRINMGGIDNPPPLIVSTEVRYSRLSGSVNNNGLSRSKVTTQYAFPQPTRKPVSSIFQTSSSAISFCIRISQYFSKYSLKSSSLCAFLRSTVRGFCFLL